MIKKVIVACVLIAASTSVFAATQSNPCKGKSAGDKVTVTGKNGKTADVYCRDLASKKSS